MRAFYTNSSSNDYRLSSTHSTLTIQAPPHASHHHDHAQTLHQARHLQSYWHWAAVATPTMCLLKLAPTTEAPHAFHHQLEHRHCLFITPVSAEPWLPHLNSSSYRAAAAASHHRSLLWTKHAHQAMVLSTLGLLCPLLVFHLSNKLPP
jgi:hypothetical protein